MTHHCISHKNENLIKELGERQGRFILAGEHCKEKSQFVTELQNYLHKALEPKDNDKEWKKKPVLHFEFAGYCDLGPSEFSSWIGAYLFDLQSLYARYPETDDLGGRLLHVARGASGIIEQKCALIVENLDAPFRRTCSYSKENIPIVRAFLDTIPELKQYVDFMLFSVQDMSNLGDIADLINDFEVIDFETNAS